jgi:Flp pilus assembly protein TadG
MALVAAAMVAIISMAALSIDIGTLYEAKAETQRAADAAALAAARIISLSGITGDPTNASTSWQPTCGGNTSLATSAAIKVAQQNSIAGVAVPTASVKVTYGAGKAGGAAIDCSTLGSDFGVNPIVTVNVQRTNLPLFFAHVFSLLGSSFSSTSVSASATAEAFNPSKSGSVASLGMIPVRPRCVKPWIVPNVDPTVGGGGFVSLIDGSIVKQGVLQLGGGVIGETFTLAADCHQAAGNCMTVGTGMIANPPTSGGNIIHYVPALGSGNASAVPACSNANPYQAAIGGCDQNAVYACGTPLGAEADLTENPVHPTRLTGDTSVAAQCLINQSVGSDSLDTVPFPFQIRAGLGSPLAQTGVVNTSDVVTTSNNIVTVPIYDGLVLGAGANPAITIVGFLQVFINDINGAGDVNVTVMNVAGCSNNAAGNPTVTGTSPVPVRLITAP